MQPLSLLQAGWHKYNFTGNAHLCTTSPSSCCGQLMENIRCCLHSAIADRSFLPSKADLSWKIQFFCSFALKDFVPFFLSNITSLRMCVYVKRDGNMKATVPSHPPVLSKAVRSSKHSPSKIVNEILAQKDKLCRNLLPRSLQESF